MVRAGETPHDKGDEGLQKARRWLSLTTRVSQTWTHKDTAMAEMLQYEWPDGSGHFYLDLGGRFRGGDVDGQYFTAEVKNYRRDNGGLKTHFQDFLARCYVDACRPSPRYSHYLWIAWAPFDATAWDQHGTADDVKRALLLPRNRKRCLQSDDEGEATKSMRMQAVANVSERLWMVTMNDKQNDLVVTREHFRLIVGQFAEMETF